MFLFTSSTSQKPSGSPEALAVGGAMYLQPETQRGGGGGLKSKDKGISRTLNLRMC